MPKKQTADTQCTKIVHCVFFIHGTVYKNCALRIFYPWKRNGFGCILSVVEERGGEPLWN